MLRRLTFSGDPLGVVGEEVVHENARLTVPERLAFVGHRGRKGIGSPCDPCAPVVKAVAVETAPTITASAPYPKAAAPDSETRPTAHRPASASAATAPPMASLAPRGRSNSAGAIRGRLQA